MLIRKINQGKALLAWHIFVQKLNSEQPVVERKRKRANGTEQVFYTQSKLIPGNVEATGTRLIQDYIKAYEHAARHGFEPENEGDLPSLFTNAPRLADRRTVSDRTIRNHISRLRKVGLITGYVFHGTFHDFELWINPEILFETVQKAETEAQKTTQAAAPEAPQNINFPLNVAFETTCNIENKSTDVDKGVSEPSVSEPQATTQETAPQQCAMPAGDGVNGNTGGAITGNTGLLRAGQRAKRRLYSPVGSEKLETGAGGAAAAEVTRNAVFLAYVESFWQYAKRLLYPADEFFPEQETLAKRAIWKGVYGSFNPEYGWSDRQWEWYHGRAIQRLELAEAWFRKNPGKYPSMPYAEVVEGQGYFDRENKYGFVATNEWLKQLDVWRHENKVNEALRASRADFWLHTKGKASKRIQEKSKLQLFKYWENRMRRLGPEALQKFYKQHAINQ